MQTRIAIECLEDRRLFSTLPSGFSDTVIATGLDQPTSSLALPDGRVLVTQKTGALRVIKNGVLLSAPAISLSVDSTVERGLLCAAIDANFASDHYVYLNYQAAGNNYNQISRFTLSGDSVVAGSEVKLFQVDPQLNNAHHIGGGMAFGTDGKLYIGVGDNEVPADAQSLSTMHGKLLRINADGSIPADNPYVGQLTGSLQAIYAIGLRNPFTLGIDATTGKVLINDVGSTLFEEIDVGRAGANYGWPSTEGMTSNPAYDSPVYAYPPPPDAPVVQGGGGLCIAGGAFYSGVTQQFPAAYKGQYFFGDYENGFIRTLDPATGIATPFATGVGRITDIDIAADGTLLATTYDGSVHAIKYTAPASPPPVLSGNSTLSGYVVEDTNRDRQWSGGESAIANRTVWVDQNDDGIMQDSEPRTLTNSAGKFTFHVPAGNYRLREIIPAGWVQETPSGNASLGFSVADGATKSINFLGYTATTSASAGQISVKVYQDLNGNGAYDNGDTLFSGIPVYIDSNSDGQFESGEPSVGTTSGGVATFTGLTAGTYQIRTRPVDGLVASTPQPLTVKSDGLSAVAVTLAMAPSPVTPPANPAVTTIEAETGTLAGGTYAMSNHANYTGTGFADFGGNGSSGQWSINRTAGGTATIAFRYANGGSSNRPMAIFINGVNVGTLAFSPTGSWDTWLTTSIAVNLASGINLIKAVAGTATGGNIDSLTIT